MLQMILYTAVAVYAPALALSDGNISLHHICFDYFIFVFKLIIIDVTLFHFMTFCNFILLKAELAKFSICPMYEKKNTIAICVDLLF